MQGARGGENLNRLVRVPEYRISLEPDDQVVYPLPKSLESLKSLKSLKSSQVTGELERNHLDHAVEADKVLSVTRVEGQLRGARRCRDQ